MIALASIDDVEVVNQAHGDEVSRIDALCDVFLQLPPEWRHLQRLAPQSAEYRRQIELWLNTIRAMPTYDPSTDELSPFLQEDLATQYIPSIYKYNNSKIAGQLMQAYGMVLRTLSVNAGDSVIEYGPGDGQIALSLARLGCDVTVIDIEDRYLKVITSQAERLGVKIHTIKSSFEDFEADRTFDRVLFFESFHHAIDHRNLVAKLRTQLRPNGYIVFAGEPIVADGSHFRQTVPYPWGPRLDGLSIRAMRAYGWCELGFHREYFVELMMRNGFVVSFIQDANTERGSAYVARPTPNGLDIGGDFLVEGIGAPNSWWPGEGNLRWTRTERAALPLFGRQYGHDQVRVTFENHLPVEKLISLQLGTTTVSQRMAPGTKFETAFELVGDDVLWIHCPLHRLSDLNPTASHDDRNLGIAVSSIFFFKS